MNYKLGKRVEKVAKPRRGPNVQLVVNLYREAEVPLSNLAGFSVVRRSSTTRGAEVRTLKQRSDYAAEENAGTQQESSSPSLEEGGG